MSGFLETKCKETRLYAVLYVIKTHGLYISESLHYNSRFKDFTSLIKNKAEASQKNIKIQED